MKNRRRFAVLLTLLTAVASTVVAVAVAHPALADATDNFRSIQNYGSGMCIQPASTDIGVQLVQEPCDPTVDAQRWALGQLSDGTWQLWNKGTGGCMDAHGPNADRTPVDTWPCSTISNQKWTITRATPAQFVSAIGGRCLDVFGGSLAAGAPIQIYHCTNANTAQAWFILF